MVVNDIFDACDDSQQYLNKKNCAVLNELLKITPSFQRIVFGNVIVRYGFYIGLVESNGLFKYFCNMNNKIVDYAEFNDIYDALSYTFDVCKSLDHVTNYDYLFRIVTNRLGVKKNKVLGLNNNADNI